MAYEGEGAVINAYRDVLHAIEILEQNGVTSGAQNAVKKRVEDIIARLIAPAPIETPV